MALEDSKRELRRIVRFVYLSPYRPRTRPKPHWQRDESPAFELILALCAQGGFAYGGADRLFINSPRPEQEDSSVEDLRALGLCERDILLLTTRPPLDDSKEEEVKPLRESNSKLEQQLIFPALGESCISYCSRGNVVLNQTAVRSLKPGFHGRSDIVFSRRGDPDTLSTGTYTGVHGIAEHPVVPVAPWDEMSTAGYLVHMPLGPGLPSLFAVFGMSGTTTLALAYLLTKNAAGLEVLTRALQAPSFTMVEIQTAPIAGDLIGYGFCDSWDMRVIASL